MGKLKLFYYCASCNKSFWKRVAVDGPNAFIFVALLCFGVVPGLLYIALTPTRYGCPDCGNINVTQWQYVDHSDEEKAIDHSSNVVRMNRHK